MIGIAEQPIKATLMLKIASEIATALVKVWARMWSLPLNGIAEQLSKVMLEPRATLVIAISVVTAFKKMW